jgi:hypothetical protein
MRKNFIIYILFCILTVNLFSQSDTTLIEHLAPSKQQCQKALQYYLISLDYQNDGVVQSAIENIMTIKCHHSDIDYYKVISKLDYLAGNAKSTDTRTMAFVCRNYLVLYNPSQIEKQKTRELLSLIISR